MAADTDHHASDDRYLHSHVLFLSVVLLCTGIEDLGDYVVKINETDSTPITFNINPNTLFAGLSDQVQTTKDLFRTRSIIATAIIILLSSICTYFISRRALQPLRRLSNEVNKIDGSESF